MGERLKPCPFCGSRANLVATKRGDYPTVGVYSVRCSDCQIETREMYGFARGREAQRIVNRKARTFAVTAWNQRKEPRHA